MAVVVGDALSPAALGGLLSAAAVGRAVLGRVRTGAMAIGTALFAADAEKLLPRYGPVGAAHAGAVSVPPTGMVCGTVAAAHLAWMNKYR